MSQPTGVPADELPNRDGTMELAWRALLAAARAAEQVAAEGRSAAFALDHNGELKRMPAGSEEALMAWDPGSGWETLVSADDPRRALIDLYLPVCSATGSRPITVGHLGQSLDGFIATHSGDSQFVTGEENILHLHRMRALSDAVIVGAGTVAADDPQLTTRHVAGPNPLRVVLDPTRRLSEHYRLFTDESVATLYVCARSMVRAGERHFGRAAIVAVDDQDGGIDMASLVALLRARGCTRIFVEGGGVTVSMFLEANLLDRLQVAIAPLIIGDGRPAIRLPGQTALSDCYRPRYRVFRMGADVIFDCELKPRDDDDASSAADTGPRITRVI